MQQPVSARAVVTSQGDATHIDDTSHMDDTSHVDETTQKAAAMIQAGDSQQATRAPHVGPGKEHIIKWHF